MIDVGLLYQGLVVSLIGIFVVFLVLSILATIIYFIPYMIPKRRRGEKPVAIEKRLEEKQGISSDELITISAAINAFNEYKYSRLRETYPLFKDFPALMRLLYMAGIRFRGRIIVSVGGSDKTVEIEEIGRSAYRVKIGGREYNVVVRYEDVGKPVIQRIS
jgi:Na+-transporting methylmalonyl-CoA/oxaloacetate decarboxylase gamma subunit